MQTVRIRSCPVLSPTTRTPGVVASQFVFRGSDGTATRDTNLFLRTRLMLFHALATAAAQEGSSTLRGDYNPSITEGYST